MRRKEHLANNQIYHIFTRSIADYVIFNGPDEFQRMLELLKYYQIKNEIKFSDFIQLRPVMNRGFDNYFDYASRNKEDIVQIIAYCLMPTHLHLILKQLSDGGISAYMGNILNSFTHYFNKKHRRKGPLWESKFKNVPVNNDEQLLHLTRYIHLNPVTAFLVNKPEQWSFSSYKEYILKSNSPTDFCQFEDIIDIRPTNYKKFVNNQISYQRELAEIKKLLFD